MMVNGSKLFLSLNDSRIEYEDKKGSNGSCNLVSKLIQNLTQVSKAVRRICRPVFRKICRLASLKIFRRASRKICHPRRCRQFSTASTRRRRQLLDCRSDHRVRRRVRASRRPRFRRTFPILATTRRSLLCSPNGPSSSTTRRTTRPKCRPVPTVPAFSCHRRPSFSRPVSPASSHRPYRPPCWISPSTCLTIMPKVRST